LDCLNALRRALGIGFATTSPVLPQDVLAAVSNDNTPPTCVALARTSSSLTIGVQDTESGMSEIVLEATNASVSLPGFTPGSTSLLPILAAKQDLSLPARVQLVAVDVCGNSTLCDPLMTNVLRATDKPVWESYPNLPQEENTVTIWNGSPGLKNFDILVNSVRFKVAGMRDGEERTLDVSSAMLPGSQNIISLKGNGKPGSSASILIWDGRAGEP